MYKNLFIGLMGLFLLGSCGQSAHSHDEHDHEGHSHETESHTHEGHDHDSHSHEGHNHETDGHNHEAEAHSHEADEHNHETDGHNHGGSDEIILPPAKAQAAGVKVATLTPTTFHAVIHTSGQVLAAQGEESTVVAPMAGVVSFKNRLTEGMSVSKGAALLTLSARNMAEGDPVEKARINYETARLALERAERLVKEQIISRKAYEEARQTYENARIAYEGVGGKLTETGQAQGNRRSEQGGQQVTAPLAGYVKSLLVNEGDYVEVGQPLASITQNRKLFLRADVSENYYRLLSTLRTAHFRPAADPQTYALNELNGRLLSYGKAAGTGSHYLPVTFEFDNRGDIMPGAFSEVWLISSPIEGALTLPKTALVEEQGSYFVFIQLDEEGYRKQLVTTGADDGRMIQILSGVEAGQRIVVEGAQQVKLASASNAIPAHSHEH